MPLTDRCNFNTVEARNTPEGQVASKDRSKRRPRIPSRFLERLSGRFDLLLKSRAATFLRQNDAVILTRIEFIDYPVGQEFSSERDLYGAVS